ncbi:MAG TPA: cytochrome b/b6 domain-containing protein [Hyphomicrobiaceae bacterium]|nr:cytochrome b/b6 domain-containing protein [Hyphomicrobiaceae bacterium]
METSAKPGGASDDRSTVRTWDVPTRLFHWTLVTLIVMAWVSRKYGDTNLVWHTWNGYAILVLIVYRIIWGFVGGSTARFSSFVSGPVTAVRYGLDFATRKPRHFLGHNPLGGTMVLALLAVVGFQATIGLFSYEGADAFVGGPLSSKVSSEVTTLLTTWHIRIFDLIIIMAGLHITANIVYLFWKPENLIKPMLTGRKPKADYEDQQEAEFGSIGKALVCLVVATILVFGTIKVLGGRIF